MNKTILHTPEGVRDIYDDEIEKRDIIISKAKNLIKSYGYDNISTPTFEYMDVFCKDFSPEYANKLYKFFDKDGKTLVLRPDFTPSIARATSKYFTDDKVVRLTYDGSVFKNNKRYQGRLKESYQLGGELIGEDSVDADAEVISISVNVLKACNITDFKLSIGHADIIKGLFCAHSFTEEDAEIINSYMFNHNVYGLQSYLEGIGSPKKLTKLFAIACVMYTPESKEWQDFLSLSEEYEMLHNALNYLDELYKVLKIYEVSEFITFEPGRVSEYDYYTGIIFAGYTKGYGESVVVGGRYDNLMSDFGKERPAIGFGIFIDSLLLALSNQNIKITDKTKKIAVLYNASKRSEAIIEASARRNKGEYVELIQCDGDFDKKKAEYDDVEIVEIR